MKIRTMAGAVALGLSLGVAQAPASAQANAAASQEELLFWDTIKNSANPADFQEYLKQYPNGRFAGLARIRARGAAAAPAAGGMARNAPSPAIPAGPAVFPVAGEAWKYRFLDRKYAPRHPLQYEVRVVKAEGGRITEALAPIGGAPKESTIDTSDLTFLPRSLPSTKLAMEFSPYWIWRAQPMASPTRIGANSGYPLDRNTAPWQVDVTSAPAPAVVPAGTFSGAVKVVLKGSRQASFDMSRRNSEVARFEVTAWYAKEAGRVLKIEHRAWYGDSQPAADEVIELLEHDAGGAALAGAEQKIAVAAPAASSPDLKIVSGLAPLQGEIWSYRFTDRKYGNKVQLFSIRVDGVQGSVVRETVEPAGAKMVERSVDLAALLFNAQPLPAERMLVEFAPYISQLEHAAVLPYKMRAGSGYPRSATSGDDWQVVLARLADAPVALGSSKVVAQRYQLKGMRRVPAGVARFEVTAWYTPEAKRYVRLEHKVWNSNSSLSTDDLVELVELPHR